MLRLSASRLSSTCLRPAAATLSRALVARISSSSARFFTAEPLSHEKLDNLHSVIEQYRSKNFPETLPHIFLEDVLEAADENKNGKLSVPEVAAMLHNINEQQPLEFEEVRFIMERDLGLEPDATEVSLADVKKLLFEIDH
eukprot:CAMPEP_0185737252 /NCGR_PEP_ID=MMETSP1171-20130828/29976_1 /TAXON_ID=374046 /ORGANISM="Helicotheca tamensis, Strain CCMP826" /LENGTH=140 /DNA_ID=CAMNT_0028408127 /DNA_START=85 /DNA_END=507 /DNA_ORIENTATION=+